MTEENTNGIHDSGGCTADSPDRVESINDPGTHSAASGSGSSDVHLLPATKLDSADLGASKPVPVRTEPTESEVRAWRAANWTVQQPTVVKCGHKLNLRQFPNQSNCYSCWEAWFSAEENQQGLAAVHDMLLKDGNKAVVAMHGKKFTRAFATFLRNKLLSLASPETQALSGLEVKPLEEINEVH